MDSHNLVPREMDLMNMTKSCRRATALGLMLATALAMGGCAARKPAPGTPLTRQGDEIVVAGQLFHTGAPVVTWMDPGGYDAYRTERRFVRLSEAAWSPDAGPDSPARYNTRSAGLTDEELEQVRGGGWTLDLLRDKVDQFVLHYDVCGTARQCFNILHDHRGLSVHFMLDIDGTIYQTLDLKERAWHATKSNHRSIGIEIANIGAYPERELSESVTVPAREGSEATTRTGTLYSWYKPEFAVYAGDELVARFHADGAGYVLTDVSSDDPKFDPHKGDDRAEFVRELQGAGYNVARYRSPTVNGSRGGAADAMRINLPSWMGDGGVRTEGFVGYPARGPIKGEIQGRELVQYDLTPEQYDSLIKLTAALCTIFPKIECDYPRTEDGALKTTTLTDEEWRNFHGILGHWHIQDNKIDPGPALQWDYLVTEARKLMPN